MGFNHQHWLLNGMIMGDYNALKVKLLISATIVVIIYN